MIPTADHPLIYNHPSGTSIMLSSVFSKQIVISQPFHAHFSGHNHRLESDIVWVYPSET